MKRSSMFSRTALRLALRRRQNSRALSAAVVAAFVASAVPLPAHAQQLVICPTCSQQSQSLLAYARQLLQLQQEIRMVTYAIRNTTNLPNTLFSDITGDINRLMNISSSASLLQDNSVRFLDSLADAGGYPVFSVDQWWQRIIQQQNDIALKTKAFADMMDLQPQQLNDYSATLNAMQNQAQTAEGRQQTLQAIAAIDAAVGQQTKTTQSIIAAGLQAQLSVTTAQADRRALEDAVVYMMVDVDPLPVTGQTFQVGQ